jgi:hypothetical protein
MIFRSLENESLAPAIPPEKPSFVESDVRFMDFSFLSDISRDISNPKRSKAVKYSGNDNDDLLETSSIDSSDVTVFSDYVKIDRRYCIN